MCVYVVVCVLHVCVSVCPWPTISCYASPHLLLLSCVDLCGDIYACVCMWLYVCCMYVSLFVRGQQYHAMHLLIFYCYRAWTFVVIFMHVCVCGCMCVACMCLCL